MIIIYARAFLSNNFIFTFLSACHPWRAGKQGLKFLPHADNSLCKSKNPSWPPSLWGKLQNKNRSWEALRSTSLRYVIGIYLIGSRIDPRESDGRICLVLYRAINSKRLSLQKVSSASHSGLRRWSFINWNQSNNVRLFEVIARFFFLRGTRRDQI